MPTQTLYESPPGSGKNDGALPTTYILSWQIYNNLTPGQILAFQSFPQDLALYAGVRRWQAEISGVTVNGIPLATNERDKILAMFLNVSPSAVIQFKDATGAFHALSTIQVRALCTGMNNFITTLFATESQIVTGINATPPTVTTRAQIDAAIAAVAPNSPSALTPSPT